MKFKDMLPIRLCPMHYSDLRDLLQYITETTEKSSSQYKATIPILEAIDKNTRLFSKQRKMLLLEEALKKSEWFQQKVKNLSGII